MEKSKIAVNVCLIGLFDASTAKQASKYFSNASQNPIVFGFCCSCGGIAGCKLVCTDRRGGILVLYGVRTTLVVAVVAPVVGES